MVSGLGGEREREREKESKLVVDVREREPTRKGERERKNCWNGSFRFPLSLSHLMNTGPCDAGDATKAAKRSKNKA